MVKGGTTPDTLCFIINILGQKKACCVCEEQSIDLSINQCILLSGVMIKKNK